MHKVFSDEGLRKIYKFYVSVLGGETILLAGNNVFLIMLVAQFQLCNFDGNILSDDRPYLNHDFFFNTKNTTAPATNTAKTIPTISPILVLPSLSGAGS